MIYTQTCGLNNPKDRSVCFALTKQWMQVAAKTGLRLEVFCPFNINTPDAHNIRWISCLNPLYEFIRFHNRINQYKAPAENVISDNAYVSKFASIGDEGLRYIKSPNGEYLLGMKHMGNVIIQDDVSIGSFSTVARATFDSTIIGRGTKIDNGVHIGHNCKIGKRCLIVQGASLLGSVTVGDDCFIGGNAVIRNGVTIAQRNMIGMGAVVTKSILDSNCSYIGNPAKRLKPWDGKII